MSKIRTSDASYSGGLASARRPCQRPNDERFLGTAFRQRGLSGLLWAGQVLESSLIDALERQNRAHPYHDASRFRELVHHIVLTKERTIEVVARSLTVERHDGSTMAAAVATSGQ